MPPTPFKQNRIRNQRSGGEAKQKERKQAKAKPSLWRQWSNLTHGEKVGGFIAMLGVVVAGAIGLVEYGQYVTGQRELELKRAQIFVENTEMHEHPGTNQVFAVGGRPIFKVTFVNRGETQATKFVQAGFATVLSLFPVHTAADYRQNWWSRVMGSQVNPTCSDCRIIKNTPVAVGMNLDEPLTATDIENIASRKSFLIVYGVARYDDGVGYERFTLYCRYFNPTTKSFDRCPTHDITE